MIRIDLRLLYTDDTTAAKELSKRDLRSDARVLAKERRRSTKLSRDPSIPATKKSWLQTR